VNECVKFEGWVDHDELPGWLASSKVYVSTSLSDSLAISNLEAMACGIFPIVTDIPSNREWIEDGENGFIVPTDDPEILAQRMVEAMGNEKIREKAGIHNRRIVGERANWNKNMMEIEELYRVLVRGVGARD
jgi:glycosyltransferase involved in cell wall biosynthesis